jgi:hypothetical protein
MIIPHEYKLIVKFFPISEKNSFDSPEGRKELMAPLTEFLQDKLPEAIVGSGWSINSHNIAFVRNQAVLSVLLQRGLL